MRPGWKDDSINLRPRTTPDVAAHLRSVPCTECTGLGLCWSCVQLGEVVRRRGDGGGG